MGQSPGHRFGQIIGDTLEAGIRPLLAEFARTHGLYLDGKGARACRSGKKCSWVDLNGNAHDLDFVLERGGTAEKIGMPAAFIETAWRRYTKQSQEVTTIADAIRFIEGYAGDGSTMPVERYEIDVRYNNGDVVRGQFRDKSAAIEFLRGYQPVLPTTEESRPS